MVLNDDCMNVLPTLSDNSVDMILTDIPYDVVNRDSHGLRNLDKDIADNLNFDLGVFLEECYRVCKGSIYIFCSTEQVSYIRHHLSDKKLTTRLCIWEKTNPSPMNGEYFWLSSIECCVFARKKKSVFNERCKSCVWRFPNGRSKLHPTEKPLSLFQYIVSVSSNEGDTVLDPCAGVGTTGLACKNLNRNYILIEKDPGFYEIMVGRGL